MSVFHERTLSAGGSLSGVQIACNNDLLALPHKHSAIAVWNILACASEPVILEGHRRSVTALAFSCCRTPELLCSAAAADYVITWNVQHILSNKGRVTGRVVCPVPTAASSVGYISFGPENQLIAICTDKLVHVLDVQGSKVKAVLEGHTANVNCAEFCPHYTSTLVSVSDDRTFKVWGIASSTMLYQSTIISASPFISLAMNPVHESFAVGSSDGLVRVYDLADGHDFRCLHQLDVSKLARRLEPSSSAPSTDSTSDGPVTISRWRRADCGDSPQDTGGKKGGEQAEVSMSVLSLQYCNAIQSFSAEQQVPSLLTHSNDNVVSDLLSATPMLFIGTMGTILQLDATSLEPASVISLRDSVISRGPNERLGRKSLSFAGNVSFAQSTALPDKVWCIVGKLFRSEVDILSIWCTTPDGNTDSVSTVLPSSPVSSSSDIWWRTEDDGEMDDDSISTRPGVISVISSNPLLPNSPLAAELQPKSTPAKPSSKPSVTGAVKPGALNKKGQIVDKQAVTFHNKIKSSGYATSKPRPNMFQPKTNFGVKPQKTATSSSKPVKEYPLMSSPPTDLQFIGDVAERPTAVNSLCFSERGENLSCSLMNATATVFSSSKKNLLVCDSTFAGHSQSVTSANWSHDGRLLITSSDDKTANLWSLGSLDPVMTFAATNQNLATAASKSNNAVFTKPVRWAQFYYIDRFILLVSGDSFHLYKYHLDLTKSDIQLYLSNNKYKLVHSFQLEKVQNITAFSAINSFHSYIALAAGSDKSLQVFDINVGSSVRTLPDVHSRNVHHIAQNSSSPFASHSSSVYDLFLTSAVSDGIKLWDLRSNRCVRRYDGHINRVHSCTAQISPCCRYVATGSEDKCAYLYDIRSGSYLHKLTGHAETVSTVAFHPEYPQLVTATLDGKIRLFTDIS